MVFLTKYAVVFALDLFQLIPQGNQEVVICFQHLAVKREFNDCLRFIDSIHLAFEVQVLQE